MSQSDELKAAVLKIAIDWELMHMLRQRGHKGSWPRDRFEATLDAALEEAGFEGHAEWYRLNVVAEAEREADRLSPKDAA